MPRRHQSERRGGLLPRGLEPIERDNGMVISQPGLAEQLFRAFDLKGDLPQAMEQYFGLSVNCIDLTAMEYRRLRRQSSFGGGGFCPAVAAAFSVLQLYPNANSQGQLIKVEQLAVFNPDAAAVGIYINTGPSFPVGVSFNAITRDIRDLKPSGCSIEATSSAVFPQSGFYYILGPGQAVNLQLELVTVTNGGAIRIGATVLNKALHMAMSWTERDALPGELS